MIIGITGMACSGGGSFAELLQEHGFKHLSYSGILREELNARGIEVTRESMQDLGNEIRENHGSGELSKRLIATMSPEKNYVLTTIRNPAEIQALKETGNFILVHITAPKEIRFERLIARNREKRPTNWEDFLRFEEKESGVGQQESGLRIADCIPLADITITNDGTFEDLKKKADEFASHYID